VSLGPPPGNPGFSSYPASPHAGLPSPHDAHADVTDSRARNSLILGLIAIFPFSILTGIPAIFAGAHALRRIKASDGTLKGRRIAWCGIVLGCISVAVFSVFLYRVYR